MEQQKENDEESKTPEQEEATSSPEHKAAYLVSFILRRSLSSPPEGSLTKLGFLSVRTLWMVERSALARLVQLESLVSDRWAEEKRALRALAREQRRLEREKRRLEEKKDALRVYRKVLSTPADARHLDEDEDEEEEEFTDDDDEDEEEDNDAGYDE